MHDEIIKKAEDILDIEFKLYALKEDLLSDVKCLMDEIICITREAKEMGQNMENRLNKYRTAIEDLGFKRYYKKEY